LALKQMGTGKKFQERFWGKLGGIEAKKWGGRKGHSGNFREKGEFHAPKKKYTKTKKKQVLFYNNFLGNRISPGGSRNNLKKDSSYKKTKQKGGTIKYDPTNKAQTRTQLVQKVKKWRRKNTGGGGQVSEVRLKIKQCKGKRGGERSEAKYKRLGGNPLFTGKECLN